MESMNKRIEEIGKQVGGWRNWALNNNSESNSAGVSRAYEPGKRA